MTTSPVTREKPTLSGFPGCAGDRTFGCKRLNARLGTEGNNRSGRWARPAALVVFKSVGPDQRGQAHVPDLLFL
jgi:hypothetical protein